MTREGTLRSGWQNLARVISSEGRNLKLETAGCAMILDSSLRCVQNDRGGTFRSGWQSKLLGCVRDGRGGTFRSGWQSKLLRCVRDDILREIL